MATATIPRGSANGTTPPWAAELHEIPITSIDIGANVRTDIGDLAGLADSIRAVGVLEPIRVAEVGAGKYELVFGQRRLAAAAAAGLETIPALVDAGAMVAQLRTESQLIENLQREDLAPLEEAAAIRAILDADPKLTQATLAKRLGRAAPTVSNSLRLLDLTPPVQALINDGKLTAAHGKALLALSGKGQVEVAKIAVDHNWSAHYVEEHIQRMRDTAAREAKQVDELASWAEATEKLLIEKGADKKASKLTTTDGYGYGGADPALKALKARGWKSAGNASWSRGKCDCDAWGVNRTYQGGAQVVRRCIVQAHYAEKQKAAGKSDSDRYTRQEEERRRSYAQATALQAGIRGQVEAAFAKLPADVGRLLLWSMFGYNVNDWVRDHKGDRKKPDAWAELAELKPVQLTDELTLRLLKDLAPQYNIHLDWPAVAEAFGVTLAEPKAKKAVKA